MAGEPPQTNEADSVVAARPLGWARVIAPQSDLQLPYVRRADAVLDLALIVLAAIVLPYLPGLLAPIGPDDIEMAEVGATVILQKWCEAGLAVGLFLYFVLRHRFRPASFGLRRDQLGLQALWGVGALAGMYIALFATSILVVAIFVMFPAFEGELARRVEFVDTMPVHNLPATLILLVAVALHEELLFRGLLIPYLRRVLGGWWSAGLISALIFAALHVPHQGLLGGAQIFSIGVILAFFFILSRSLLAVTIAHLLFDLFQFQLMRILPDLQELLEGFEA